MKLTWMGTAALLLESADVTLAFDPFCGIPIGSLDTDRTAMPNAPKLQSADAVFVTHGHFDHILDIPALYARSDVPVYATATPWETMRKNGMPQKNLRRIAPGWTGAFGPFQVTVWQGRHCKFDRPLVLRTVFRGETAAHPAQMGRLLALNGAYAENGETLFYEVTADGVRLQIMGSMGLDAQVSYPTGADALVLPFQGKSDPGREAEQIVQRLRPRSILLDHYDDTFPPMSSQIPTEGFVLKMEEQGIPCRALTIDQTIEIRREHTIEHTAGENDQEKVG